MSDIISAIDKMNDVEIAGDAPLTEALLEKIGANINGLIDEGFVITEFNIDGTLTIPTGVGVNLVGFMLIGAGGGAGAGAGTGRGGGGGGGCSGEVKVAFFPCSDGDVFTIDVGTAGVGGTSAQQAGTAGGRTTVRRTTPSNLGYAWAHGGNGGAGGVNEPGGTPTNGAGGVSGTIWNPNTFAGASVAGGAANSGPNNGTNGALPGQGGGGGGGGWTGAGPYNAGNGGASFEGLAGGLGGTVANNPGGGGGSGGGNIRALGGQGGNGASAGAATAGAVGTKGSGGGGGGGVGGGGSLGAGGDGGPGYVLAFYKNASA